MSRRQPAAYADDRRDPTSSSIYDTLRTEGSAGGDNVDDDVGRAPSDESFYYDERDVARATPSPPSSSPYGYEEEDDDEDDAPGWPWSALGWDARRRDAAMRAAGLVGGLLILLPAVLLGLGDGGADDGGDRGGVASRAVDALTAPLDFLSGGGGATDDAADDVRRPRFVYEHPYVSSTYYQHTSSARTLYELERRLRENERAGRGSRRTVVRTRLAIVRPFCEFDAEALPTTFACWDSLVPCRTALDDLGDVFGGGPDDPDERTTSNTLKEASADLFLFYSQTFSDNPVAMGAVDAILDKFLEPGGWSQCIDNIYAIEANIPQELDLYIPSAQEELYNWVNGPNRQFEAAFRIIQSGEWGDYDGFYLMEGDSIPVKTHWLDHVLRTIEDYRPFAILGAKYNGDKWDNFYESIPLSLLHHINGNAIYNTSHPLLERLVGQLEVEAPCPYNSIPYDYRMSQMVVEGALSIVPKLAPKIMLNEEGERIVLSNNTDMFGRWWDMYADQQPMKETPVIHNYAATNLIPRHLGPEYIIHGAKLYSPWDPTRTEVTLVVSEWFYDRSAHLLSHLDHSDHPFSEVVVMIPPDVEAREEYNMTVVPVTAHHRSTPDFMDLCEAPVTTEWFMLTNSYHHVATHVDLMFTPGKFQPVTPFTPATYPFCFKFPYCKETVTLAQRFNPGHDKVVQDFDMLYNTEQRDTFCGEWKDRFGEEGEDLYKHHQDRLRKRGGKIIGPKGPTGTAYAAYLFREGKDKMHKFTDRSLYGARDPFVKIFAKEEKDDGLTEEELAKLVGVTAFDNRTDADCDCKALESKDKCEGEGVGAELGCVWRPLFESCRPPEMIDDGEPICRKTETPTMSPTVFYEFDEAQTTGPTAAPDDDRGRKGDPWYANLFRVRSRGRADEEDDDDAEELTEEETTEEELMEETTVDTDTDTKTTEPDTFYEKGQTAYDNVVSSKPEGGGDRKLTAASSDEEDRGDRRRRLSVAAGNENDDEIEGLLSRRSRSPWAAAVADVVGSDPVDHRASPPWARTVAAALRRPLDPDRNATASSERRPRASPSDRDHLHHLLDTKKKKGGHYYLAPSESPSDAVGACPTWGPSVVKPDRASPRRTMSPFRNDFGRDGETRDDAAVLSSSSRRSPPTPSSSSPLRRRRAPVPLELPEGDDHRHRTHRTVVDYLDRHPFEGGGGGVDAMTAGADDPFAPLRVVLHPLTENDATSSAASAAAAAWRDALRVVPAHGPLPVEIDACGGVAVPERHRREGVADADAVVYVVVVDRDCDADRIAVCRFDQHRRPIVGRLELCLDHDHHHDHSDVVARVTSEVGRFLGLSPNLYRHFRDPDTGRLYGASKRDDDDVVTCVDGSRRTGPFDVPNVLRVVKRDDGDRRPPRYEVASPMVQQVVRNHFDCQTMMGARLESPRNTNSNTMTTTMNNTAHQEMDDESCFGSHWSKRFFLDEDLGRSHRGVALSPLTLALLEDSSWYKADYKKATSSSFGRGAGCGFVEGDCRPVHNHDDVPAHAKGFFCRPPHQSHNNTTSPSNVGCDHSHVFKAACDPTSVFPDDDDDDDEGACRLRSRRVASCLVPDDGDDDDPYARADDVFGDDSRCYETTTTNNNNNNNAVCLRTSCNARSRKVEFAHRQRIHTCDYDGQRIRLSSNGDDDDDDDDELTVECPRVAVVCPNMVCPASCSGRGICDYCASVPQCICDDPFDDSPGCWGTS